MGTFVIITQLSAPTSEESAERNLIETIIVHGSYVVHGILPKSEFFNFNFNFILYLFLQKRISRCTKNCLICKMLATNLFATSTTKKTKHQTTLPPEDQHYNGKSKNVIYLATCNHKNCAAQYIGYTTRPLRDRIYEHIQTNTSAIYKHCNQLEHPLQKVKFQILTQAPTDTKNKDLWLRQHEYNWICKLGTSKKLDKRGLNSTFYDSTER